MCVPLLRSKLLFGFARDVVVLGTFQYSTADGLQAPGY